MRIINALTESYECFHKLDHREDAMTAFTYIMKK